MGAVCGVELTRAKRWVLGEEGEKERKRERDS